MNQKFIFVFILLATISMVNATSHRLRKRATAFNLCSAQVNTTSLNVIADPDPPVAGTTENFSVFGILNSDISSSTQLVILFTDSNQSPLALPYVQQVSSNTIKAGTQFSVNASQVPVPNLPPAYSVSVVVGDPTSNSIQPLNIHSCVTSGASFDIYSVLGNAYPVASGPN